MTYSWEFTHKNTDYRVEVETPVTCYTLLRRASWGGFEKIPCMSRTEERAFPKQPAWMATAFLHGCKQAEERNV